MKFGFFYRAFVTLTVFGFVTLISAQGQHMNDHDHTGQLGQVKFATSCAPAVKKHFNHAVAWLHSFEYEEAEKAFADVALKDPRCGMAYWGIAMSNYHPLWAPPAPAELTKGMEAARKAKELGGRTPREKDYIAAIEVFYKDADTVDHRTRTFAYHDAMKKMHESYPQDQEAAVFYALTLVATGMMSNDKTYVREKEAARILNGILARQPQHPGVAHYLIHSYDYPALAHLALPAARAYAKIAPASAHAQHMPSHIFIRLGLWQEAARSNLDARASAKAFARRNKMPGVWDEQVHAMDYLVYAYLQAAQDQKAWSVLEELNSIRQIDPPSFKVAYAVSAIPARYALERRQWQEAAKLPMYPAGLEKFPWSKFPWAEAQIRFARAIGAARTKDVAGARKEVEPLNEIRKNLTVIKGDYDWAKQVEITHLIASAWLALVEGNQEQAVNLMRSAADLDDSTDKHPVTPGQLAPAREQLGELLLEINQPAAALVEFETSLKTSPNRFTGLYGAARSAKLAGDQKSAMSYYDKLVTVARLADSPRPELAEAKSYLTSTKSSASKQ